MGVLDDAIRDHIELKRKHGADAKQLEQEQQEALGPARREAPAQEDVEGGQLEADVAEHGAEAVEHDPELDELVEGEPVAVEDPAAEIFAEAPTEIVSEPDAGLLEHDAEVGQPDPTSQPDPANEPDPAGEPAQAVEPLEPDPADEPLEDDPADGEPIAEVRPDGAEDDTRAGDTPARGFVAAADEPFASQPTPEPSLDQDTDVDAGEDVLEETPDFLQETPEHDRLWFEQKPPRDFDFDD